VCIPIVKKEEAEIDVDIYTQSASATAKNRLVVKKVDLKALLNIIFLYLCLRRHERKLNPLFLYAVQSFTQLAERMTCILKALGMPL
jgi:hypothetical protein